MSYASVKDVDAKNYGIQNICKDAAGADVTISNDVLDAAGNPVTIFGTTLPTVPITEFIVTAEREFIV